MVRGHHLSSSGYSGCLIIFESLIHVPLHTLPGDIAFVAPSRETTLPQPCNFLAESLQRLGIMRYAVVLIMAQYHRSEPSPLYRDGKVHSLPELTFHFSQLGAKALRDGAPFHLKASPTGLPADVREAEKVEAFHFTQTALASSLLCEATERNQAGFLGVQFQAKLGKPLLQVLLKPLGVIPLLKAHHNI